MEQDTNAAFEANDGGIIFEVDDFGATEDAQDTNAQTQTEDSAETDTQDTNAKTEEKEAQDTEEKGDAFELTYLGEKKTLSRDEMIKCAQKGLNYDHIKEKLDALEGNELLKVAIESAKSAGMTEEEFAQQLRGQLKDREISKISKERNVDEEAARGIYESERKAAKDVEDAKKQAEEVTGELEQLREYKRVNELKEEMRRQWKDFTAAHPDIKALEDLPQEVSEAVRNGTELEAAYDRYELKQIKEQLAKQQEKKKSPGSARNASANENEGDFFLKGFIGNE